MNLKLVCTAKNDAGEDKKEYMVKIIGKIYLLLLTALVFAGLNGSNFF